MKQLTLNGSAGSSDILIAAGLLQTTAAQCARVFSPSRVHIVTDSHVAPLYLDAVAQQFDLPVSSTILPAGEEYKRLEAVEGIYHDMLSAGMTRKDLVILYVYLLTGDVTGFAAATFLRGVPLCQIPTTLWRRWTPRLVGKRRSICRKAKIWSALFISLAWFSSTLRYSKRCRMRPLLMAWPKSSNMAASKTAGFWIWCACPTIVRISRN